MVCQWIDGHIRLSGCKKRLFEFYDVKSIHSVSSDLSMNCIVHI